ncbi:MAG: DUF4405 domain-containing protein, partial [Planctomycetaceae bacterium]|nr:DUF4405 domain-containing protein [Planctomycetaceae bacterium]
MKLQTHPESRPAESSDLLSHSTNGTDSGISPLVIREKMEDARQPETNGVADSADSGFTRASENPTGNSVRQATRQDRAKLAAHPEEEHPDLFAIHISRTLVNFWLDVLMLLNLVALGVAGVIVYFVFPPGIAAKGWLLWGMTYGQWCSIQFGLLCG